MHVEQIGWVATSSLGLFGVLLFFVHTSLVLMYSMERSGLTGWLLFKNFYVRRVFRIYPLSVVAVLAALALGLDSDINGVAGLSHGALPGKLSIVSHLLLVQNIAQVKSIVNVLWSLPFEVQMYVFLPFLFVWLRAKCRQTIWPLLVLWAASLGLAMLQPHVAILARLSLLVFVPNFLGGLIAYSLPHTPRLKSFLWPIFILALVVAFTLKPARLVGWALCLALGLVIPSFGELTMSWVRVLSKRIALYSYWIYLSHQFCIWVAFGVLASHSLWLKIPALAGMLVLLPVLLYHGFEKPMIQIGLRIAASSSEPQTAAAGMTAAT